MAYDMVYELEYGLDINFGSNKTNLYSITGGLCHYIPFFESKMYVISDIFDLGK